MSAEKIEPIILHTAMGVIWSEHLRRAPPALVKVRGNFPRIIQQVLGQDLVSILQSQ